MIVLGIDPGYRNCGWCIVETHNGDKDAKVLGHGTVRNGGLKNWPRGIVEIIGKLQTVVGGFAPPDAVGVEMISWYGKRHGSLQLAHLAGALYGVYAPWCEVKLFAPKEVKKATADYPIPENFNEHEADALSLCRLVLQANNEEVVVNAKKPSNRRRR